eukprot:TRINITY_DN2484_c2_g3_i1.p1 TRINITY_DN2484_c2_g3~~TRINITY_DN2484_c2_g3_i1.p1  ORF type:complete len:321 (-),score=97.41 TRINITY_DN2484_c2_g3_i1:143-1105(-)
MQSVQRMPELARQLFSRLKKKESATSRKVAPVAPIRCSKQAWGNKKEEKTAKEMASAQATASSEMHPVMPQQDVSGDEQCSQGLSSSFDQESALKYSASAQDSVGGESEQDSEKERKQAADTKANNLEVVSITPRKYVSGASSSLAGLRPSSQKEQQWPQSDNECDGDRELGSNPALADVLVKLADVKGESFPDEGTGEGIANVDMKVEPQLQPSKVSSDEEGQFFSGPAPMDLQQCAAEVRALMAAGKVNPAQESSEEEVKEKEEDQEEEQEEEEDEEEAHERKLEDLERRLEDWDVYWRMPPIQKIQIRCLLGLRPFP